MSNEDNEIVRCGDCVHFAREVYFDDNDVKRHYAFGICGHTGEAWVEKVHETGFCRKGVRRCDKERRKENENTK